MTAAALAERSALVLDPSQQRAVDLMCDVDERIVAVTGGPGVGKSTCLAAALDVFDARDACEYALAAPTGKAARRVQETTGRPAHTIHRLLDYGRGPDGVVGFQRNRHRPLDVHVVIVDESSMIDVELGSALAAAIRPDRTRLILIGDVDQLPPVGPGRPFGDLIDGRAIPIARLTTLHRSALTSWIHTSAQAMLRGELPDLERHVGASGAVDFQFVECHEARWLLPKVRRIMTEVFPAKIDAVAQVLIPQRTGVAGIDAANTILQAALNPAASEDDPYIRHNGGVLRVRDRVIQTRNDYKRGVFNGEVGEVTAITAGGLVTVVFDGRPDAVEYKADAARALELAYALTVHRSQGSEFPWVVAVVHSTHSYMLTRQLVYTAITRARQGVVLVGDRRGLEHALSRRAPRRNTTVLERLERTIEPANSQD